MCPGGSAIAGALGDYVKEPVYGKVDMLIAGLDLRDHWDQSIRF
ncbi:nitrilase/cyanide hydratase and apolipoprotein N-acyltransferase [Bacillus atrophaeus C89]|nr:nitrilase/cyanide hydratase and apolipoprotein N-acyltransferase [Bacillus atrophaeus C89]